MIMLDNFLELKRAVESIQRDRDRAQGAFDEWKKRLKKFGVRTLKELKLKLEKLQIQEREMAVRYSKLVKRFIAENKDILEQYGVINDD